MSTNGSNKGDSTVKSEKVYFIDGSLYTQSIDDEKVIEDRVKSCEITGQTDNTPIVDQTNKNISSTNNDDPSLNGRVVESSDLSTSNTNSEDCTDRETREAESVLKHGQTSPRSIFTSVSNLDSTLVNGQSCGNTDTDVNKQNITGQCNVTKENVTFKTNDATEVKNDGLNSENSESIESFLSANNTVDQIEEHSDKTNTVACTKEVIQNDIETEENQIISALDDSDIQKSTSEEESLENKDKFDTDRTKFDSGDSEKEEFKSNSDQVGEDQTLRLSENNEKEVNQIREHEQGTGTLSQNENGQHVEDDINECLNYNEEKADNDTKGLSEKGDPNCTEKELKTDSEELEKESESISESTSQKSLNNEKRSLVESGLITQTDSKEDDKEAGNIKVKENESSPFEKQSKDIVNHADEDSKSNFEQTLLDENESEIQKELEGVYENIDAISVTTEVRISSAPESTHESDRGYSTELVIKTEPEAEDYEYDDDFEEVEENENDEKGNNCDPININQGAEVDNSNDNNLTRLETDIKTAKSDWEKSVNENKVAEENNQEKGGTSKTDTDSDIESTVVVIEGEGTPTVILSTVPDRPPSSEPDLDDKNHTEETETTTEASHNQVSEQISESAVKKELDEEVPCEPVDTIDQKEETKPVKESTMEHQEGDNIDNASGMNGEEKNIPSQKEESISECKKTTETEETENKDSGTHQDSERDDFYDEDVDDSKVKATELTEKACDQTPHKEDGRNQKASPQIEGDNSGKKKESTEGPEAPKPQDKVPEKSEEEQVLEQIVKKEDSPLDQLLKRSVEIDGSVERIDDLQNAVTSLLISMKQVMGHYQERLKLQALKDFTEDLGKFRGDFNSINDAYKRCNSMSSTISQHLKDLRHVTDDVKAQISKKFQNEDLSTWVDITPEQEKEKHKLQELSIAAEKASMAKAADAKHAMAKATVGVAEANQLVIEMEALAIEAEATATKAASNAKAAIIAAEEARKAAEERKRAEEAAKKRAEERARIKAEEDRKKKEEEEMKIIEQAALKGSSVEDERKSFLEEKARKEAERRNPKNWPHYTYNVEAGDFDPGVGCIVRSIEGSMRKNEVTCKYVDQSTNVLQLQDQEELVSNIITIHPTEEERKFTFEEPFSIALPVCNSRVPLGKEIVMKQLLSNGKWKPILTSDVQFDDFRELKFVEGRSRSFGTFVAIMRPRKDTLPFLPKGGKVISAVDSRISFTNKPGTFKHPVNATLEVQVIDVNAVSDLKVKIPNECDDLLTASPFINFIIPNKKLEKPLVVTMPLPQNQARQKRPATGLPRENKQQDVRPATARPTTIKDEEDLDDIHYLYMDGKNGWTKDTKCHLHQPKNKDVVMFEMTKPHTRFLLLRTKPGIKDAKVEKLATLLEQSTGQKNVKVFLRQRNDDPIDIKVGCILSNKIHRALKIVEEDEGYTEGPAPSRDLILQEGQQLYLKFRGNMKCVSDDPDLTMIFNSHVKAGRQLFVEEIDRFAQKGLQNYRGFLQVLTKAMIPRALDPGAPPSKGPTEMVESEILLCELLIELPKPEAEPPKPLKTAPLPLQEGPLTSGVLRYIAGYLGKEWKDLAHHLNLKPMRIQAILRQNVNKDTPQTRFDMLMAWAKRIPRSVDKVHILCSALHAVGRQDLVEEVRYRGDEFRQKRQMNARVSHLRQAFVKVAKTHTVFKQWQKFAKGLGLPDDDIKKIEASGGSGQEKCFNSLESWKDRQGENANVSELATHLRSSKHEYLSREVESIITI